MQKHSKHSLNRLAIHPDYIPWAHDVEATSKSYQRRCKHMTLMQRCIQVMCTLGSQTYLQKLSIQKITICNKLCNKTVLMYISLSMQLYLRIKLNYLYKSTKHLPETDIFSSKNHCFLARLYLSGLQLQFQTTKSHRL